MRGTQFAEQLRVDRVDAERVGLVGVARRLGELADATIDLRAVGGRRESRRGEGGQRLHAGGEVALVRTTDELVLEAERADDLGRAGEQ